MLPLLSDVKRGRGELRSSPRRRIETAGKVLKAAAKLVDGVLDGVELLAGDLTIGPYVGARGLQSSVGTVGDLVQPLFQNAELLV
jgi:hypothetical protein